MDAPRATVTPGAGPSGRGQSADHAFVAPVHQTAHIALGVGAGVAIGRDVAKVLWQVALVTVGVLIVPLWGWEWG